MVNHLKTLRNFAIAISNVLLLVIQPVKADEQDQKNVMFILDASNSMWAQIDGTPKIKIAKDVLADLVRDMPTNTKMGLIAYGHRFDRKLKACDDMELINPIGHFNQHEVANALSFVTPKGQTPIAATLLESRNWLEEQKGQDTTLVLISDGVESCDGDPCAAAKTLSDSNISTKIHVVGFALSAEQSEQIKCIATNGNGKYFDAKDAGSLTKALEEVRLDVAASKPIVVKEKEPEPEPIPGPQIVFEDDFDGEGLTSAWNVINSDLNRYIVESGELTIIASPPVSNPINDDVSNLVIHPDVLPDGDWEIEVSLEIHMQHGGEVFYFGAMNDQDNWISGGLKTNLVSGLVSLDAFIAKVEGGKESRFDATVEASTDTGYANSTERWRQHGLGNKYAKKDFIIKLRKTGRSYQMSGTFGVDGTEEFRQFETESLNMIRGKKNLFLTFGLGHHSNEMQGEGYVLVDRVIIRSLFN